MALKGDLSTIDLSHVFQMLTLSERAGTLEIDAAGGRTSLYFTGSEILLPFDRDSLPERVVRALERSGRIEPEALERAVADVRSLGRGLLDQLQIMGLLGEEEIEEAYRAQMEEEVCDLFVGADGTFEYFEGQRPQLSGLVLDERYSLPVQGILMEAARRMDEWSRFHRLVPCEDCVFEAAAEVAEVVDDEDPAVTDEVFAAVDGSTSLRELLGALKLSRYQVYKGLALLVEQRLVFEVPVEALLEQGRGLLDAQRFEPGLQRIERALSRGREEREILELAVVANEQARQIRRAGQLLGTLARRHEEAGERAESVDCYKQIRRMLPTEPEARLRLFEVWLEDGSAVADEDWDPLKECGELALILSCLGRQAEAASCLERYRDASTGDLRTIQELARLSGDLGEPKLAVEFLDGAAQRLLAERHYTPALKLLRRIRSIDPGRSGLAQAIKECEQGAGDEKPKSRQFLRVAMLSVFLGGGGGLWWSYDASAMEAYEEVPAENLALEGDFEKARESLEEFRAEHPATVASLLAARKLDELQDRAVEHEARVRALETQATDKLRRDQLRAERAYDEAIGRVRAGDYPAGLELLEKVERIAPDAAWIEEKDLRSQMRDLRSYLVRSEESFQRWRSHCDAGRWAEAHAAAVELRTQYPYSPHVDDVDLPVVFNVIPEQGSKVIFRPVGAVEENWRVAQAPAVLRLSPDVEFEVEVTAEGHRSQRFTIDPGAASRRRVELIRELAVEARLPVSLVDDPVPVEGGWVGAGRQGCLFRWDREAGVTVWESVLEELEELVGAPVVFRDQVIAAGHRSLHAYGLAEGDKQAGVPLEGSALGAAAVCRGIVAVAVASEESQARLQAWNLPTLEPRWSGPEIANRGLLVARSNGFVVAGPEGLLDVDGRDGSVRRGWTLPAEAIRLALRDDVAWVALADGRIGRWSANDEQGKLFSIGVSGVDELSPLPHGVLLRSGPIVACLGPEGEPLGRFSREGDGPALWPQPDRLVVEWAKGSLRWVGPDGLSVGATAHVPVRPTRLLDQGEQGIEVLAEDGSVLHFRDLQP